MFLSSFSGLSMYLLYGRTHSIVVEKPNDNEEKHMKPETKNDYGTQKEETEGDGMTRKER